MAHLRLSFRYPDANGVKGKGGNNAFRTTTINSYSFFRCRLHTDPSISLRCRNLPAGLPATRPASSPRRVQRTYHLHRGLLLPPDAPQSPYLGQRGGYQRILDRLLYEFAASIDRRT